MGGRGSGRSLTYCGKATTEESLPLDIRRLQRAGLLTPRQAFSWHWTVNDRVCASIEVRSEAWRVELAYGHSHNGRPAETIRQAVMLTTTPCTLGGRRPWFCCPSCSKRVAAIYGKGRLFACRQCKGLAYASQGEADDDRASRRADGYASGLAGRLASLMGRASSPRACMGAFMNGSWLNTTISSALPWLAWTGRWGYCGASSTTSRALPLQGGESVSQTTPTLPGQRHAHRHSSAAQLPV